MQKSLHIDPAKCTGCLQCEMACSYEHTGAINPSQSRIKVFDFEDEGRKVPYTCTQYDRLPFRHRQLRGRTRQGTEVRPVRWRPEVRHGLPDGRDHLCRFRLDRP